MLLVPDRRITLADGRKTSLRQPEARRTLAATSDTYARFSLRWLASGHDGMTINLEKSP